MMTGQKPPRAWQTEAHAKVRQGWRDNPKYRALIAACPGSGKTRCAVELADELLREGIIELVVVIAPTINIQEQWVDEFQAFGINATKDASNETLRWRRDVSPDQTMREDKAVIVLTYQQLARDPKLFNELARRHKTLLIADEVHHADDDKEFGKAIGLICENVVLSLALSGTPFNSDGGSLALCECVAGVDPDTAKPIMTTLPTYEYSYGAALIDKEVCRQVEFAKVDGSGRHTYRSLADNKLYARLIKTSAKSDPLGLLLIPDGEFMGQCIREALAALARMREAGDRRAAMLVVAQDVSNGNRLIAAIERIKLERPEWAQFANIQEIYNDTPKAHERIKRLEKDNTDIVVSVRMISEGVDVKRLRVGLFATDWLTPMFFRQFVGRFIRYEVRPPLDDLQYAVVVAPARPELLKCMREIELMILDSQISLAPGTGAPDERERKNETVGVDTWADGVGLVFRGEDYERETKLVEMMRTKSADCRTMPDAVVIRLAHAFGFAASAGDSFAPPPINWRDRNNNCARQIVKLMRTNGEPDEELFARVNGAANKHAGIPKMDAMTPDGVLQKRWQFLQDWLRRVISEIDPGLFK